MPGTVTNALQILSNVVLIMIIILIFQGKQRHGEVSDWPKVTQLVKVWSWDFMYIFGYARSWLQHSGSFFFFFLSSCSMWTLSWGMWDLVPRPGIEPQSPALGAQGLNHWTRVEIWTVVCEEYWSGGKCCHASIHFLGVWCFPGVW